MHDAIENVGEPISQHRQRRSPYRYIGYMDLMSESVEFDTSSLEEVVQQVWVDGMVEEYESMIRNNV